MPCSAFGGTLTGAANCRQRNFVRLVVGPDHHRSVQTRERTERALAERFMAEGSIT